MGVQLWELSREALSMIDTTESIVRTNDSGTPIRTITQWFPVMVHFKLVVIIPTTQINTFVYDVYL